MGRKAIQILSNDATLTVFRTEASKQAQRFDISNIVPQYESLYVKCLGQGKG
jgi:hypothetical protein